MQYFVLLLVNIFIGALVYLIISLKLEKSASDYREKRLKREMDEVIREFNAAAERNISILENKIRILKKLLVQKGDLQSFDILVEDEDTATEDKREQSNHSDDTPAATLTEVLTPGRRDEPGVHSANEVPGIKSIKKGLILLLWKIKNTIRPDKVPVSHREEISSAPLVQESHLLKDDQVSRAKETLSVDLSADISKDFSSLLDKTVSENKIIREKISEAEIASLVSSETDKYSLISQLHEGGCEAEDIARYSNIPMGEVTLILNLIET